MYAVVQTGGKQYKVSPGDRIRVEKIAALPGATVDLDQVLLIAQGDQVNVGRPTLPEARVRAEVVAQGRGDKIVVFKFKAKSRYRRRTGHRQPYTELAIQEILVGKRRRARKRVEKVTEEVAESGP